MRIHRFYVNPESNTDLKHDFWLHDERLVHQWRNVLRFTAGQQVVLFDGRESERLYNIAEITDREAHLQLVTDYVRKTPSKEIYLFWSLLKKDKNDWVLQKCTELGVSHFIPLLAERSEKTGFNAERSLKIVIEASEQCGRSDIPSVREPMTVLKAIEDYAQKVHLYICEQDGPDQARTDSEPAGILIGPEGGWSDKEKQQFVDAKIAHLNLHDFTLRAETACVAAATKLIQ